MDQNKILGKSLKETLKVISSGTDPRFQAGKGRR